jgi:hypothetical protein
MSKKSRHLEFGTPIVHRKPKGATPGDLVQALAAAVLHGELPPGWSVDQPWRNSPGASWKIDDVESMIEASAGRGGDFNGIYFNRFLRLNARRWGVKLGAPRAATRAEEEADEEAVEEAAERERPEFEHLARQQKRSAAAKKAAATRRAAQAERKAAQAELARKRAAAARKGWETRRRNEAKAKRKGRKSR